MKKLGIYIHIPFCDKICNYCDFTAFQGAKSKVDEYIKALKKEIKLKSTKKYLVDSIFIVGGTPSFIDAMYIFDILENLKKYYNISKMAEITIETNPNTFDCKKLKIYKDANINRISIGVQSLNDDILKSLGRNHTKKDVLSSIEMVKKFSFNLNLDFIFGYADQTLKDILYDLDMIKKIDPEHISYYSLIIENKTKFKSLLDKGKLNLIDEDLERKMYETICEKLESFNIFQYEISNFSKKNKQSIHNKKYWQCKEYIGLGLCSHSYLDSKRFSNTLNLSKYIKFLNEDKMPIDFLEKLTKKQKKFEYIIMNMRLLSGFFIEDFNKTFNCNFLLENQKLIDDFIKEEFIDIKDGRIFFTRKGLNITDTFFVKLNY